ncbi:hypothetical protein [Sphingomonas abietis]|uniref:Uncharacterized protein n=1 Tax=Sphingomonas abietis TaxID=3012344 RepID=A0ABY7NI72_9SPHN|nr:hypothetical protein [Sphingomonas abietis]WBO20972.1 hypothetical protein PBT88_12225 [Sphingomonas abietis]
MATRPTPVSKTSLPCAVAHIVVPFHSPIHAPLLRIIFIRNQKAADRQRSRRRTGPTTGVSPHTTAKIDLD